MVSVMTEEERAIWRAAYAAAFAADFERTRRSAEGMPSHQRGGELPSDAAARVTTGDYAGWIAELAVRRLREWREHEDSEFGLGLRD